MIRLLKLIAAFFLSALLVLMKAQAKTLDGMIVLPYPLL
jgi:hypothetical protein